MLFACILLVVGMPSSKSESANNVCPMSLAGSLLVAQLEGLKCHLASLGHGYIVLVVRRIGVI